MTLNGEPVCNRLARRTHPRRVLQMVGSNPALRESRSALADALWSGEDLSKVANRLHQSIHFLRNEFAAIPESQRPVIEVDNEYVSLHFAPGTLCDVNEFYALLTCDASDQTTRLSALQRASQLLYSGEFAPDWLDSNEMSLRRNHLECQLLNALREASEIAEDLDDSSAALEFGERICRLSTASAQDHIDYAQRLSRAGRADVAVKHLQSVRAPICLNDSSAAAIFDDFIRTTQQTHNRKNLSASSGNGEKTRPPARPALLEQRAIGFDDERQRCASALRDSFTRVVTIIGLPGSGKSRLTRSVIHDLQSYYYDGIVEINGAGCKTFEQLAQRIALGFDIPTGKIQDRLRTRDLLLVVDAIELPADELSGLANLVNGLPATRWLLNAAAPLGLLSEHLVPVNSRTLLNCEDGKANTSPAVRIIRREAGHIQSDERTDINLLAAAEALDGLPEALVRMGRALSGSTSGEILETAIHQPALFLSGDAERCNDSEPPTALDATANIIRQLPKDARAALRALTGLRSWLIRDEVIALYQEHNIPDAMLDLIVRRQLVHRRVVISTGRRISLFRIAASPRAVLMADTTAHDNQQLDLLTWLGAEDNFSKPPRVLRMFGDDVNRIRKWFDNRFADLGPLLLSWVNERQTQAIAWMCRYFGDAWQSSQHLLALTDTLAAYTLPQQTQASDNHAVILQTRAALRIAGGDLIPGGKDARMALSIASAAGDDRTARVASRLISQAGLNPPQSLSQRDSVSDRGVHTANALLRVARLTMQTGDFQRAISVADDATTVSQHFGLHTLTLDALRFKARLAMAMGETDTAVQCASRIEALATEYQGLQAQPYADLVRAEVLLANQQFAEAARLGTTAAAGADASGREEPSLQALRIIAWSHYQQGAWRLSRALCNELCAKRNLQTPAELSTDIQLLNALAAQRLGDPLHAQQSLITLGDLWTDLNYTDRSRQTRINLAELALRAGRPDLADEAINAIQISNSLGENTFLPWERQRITQLLEQLKSPKQPARKNQAAVPIAALVYSVSEAICQ